MKSVLHEAQIRALRQMTPGQRLALTASLWEHARALKEAALRAQHVDWTEDQIREATRQALQHASR